MPVDRLPTDFRLALPEPTRGYEQNEEWCVVDDGSGWRELRFHDYVGIYRVPGLYEKLFHDILQCQSPPVVCDLLVEQLAGERVEPSGLRVLDMGAGNGIVAEELRTRGLGKIVGVDIVPEAAEAAERDRPGVYDDYHVVDLTALDDDAAAEITGSGFDVLTVVAALSAGHIPPEAFRVAFDMVTDDGFVAFTIRDGALTDDAPDGFAALVRSMTASGELEQLAAVTFQHRLATTRQPVYYRAVVARKRAAAV